jgi:hypothetical protein
LHRELPHKQRHTQHTQIQKREGGRERERDTQTQIDRQTFITLSSVSINNLLQAEEKEGKREEKRGGEGRKEEEDEERERGEDR